MTNTTKAVATVIKTDGVGRMRTPAERREELLDEFDRSSLSGVKYAALVGIKYSTFARWVQRRRQRPGAGTAAAANPVQWLEAVVEQAQTPGRQNPLVLSVRLPGGAHLEITNVKQIGLAAALVRALAKPAAVC